MSRLRHHGLVLVGAVTATLIMTACGGSAPGSPDGATHASGGTVVVVAAASLTESLTRIAQDFESANPGTDVEVSFGSSSTLVQQVNNGAPANVIALAGEAAAQPLDEALVKDQRVFATNVLEIAVPPDNPAKVTGIDDLGRTGLKVVLCASTVPCGQATDATFRKARIVPSVVSREVDVKATLAKVRLGEADAAVVYHSDVVAARGTVTGIEIPPPFNTTLRYPVVRLDDDPATRAFVDFVLGAESRTTLTSFGLGVP